MLLPGSVLAGVTFPGVMVHEFAHELMCRATSTRVLDVCYFRLGNPSGYVASERASSVWKSFAISFVPFVFNSVVGFLLGLASAGLYRAGGHWGFTSILLFYLGISLALHAFPSLQDAKVIDDELWVRKTGIVVKVVCAPFVFLFAMKAVINMMVVDLIWGLAVGGVLPFLLLRVK